MGRYAEYQQNAPLRRLTEAIALEAYYRALGGFYFGRRVTRVTFFAWFDDKGRRPATVLETARLDFERSDAEPPEFLR